MRSGKLFGLRSQLFAASCAALLAVQVSSAQETKEKVTVDDVDRSFMLRLPRGYDAKNHYPVMIMLHGANQDADDIERLTRFDETADKIGIITLYPVSSNGKWNIGVRPQERQRQSGMGPGRRRGGGGYPGGGYPGGGGGYPRGGNYPQQQPRDQEPSEEHHHGPSDDIAFFNAMLDQVSGKYSVDSTKIYAAGLSEGGFMAERVGCAMADRVAAVASVGASMPKTMICLPSRTVPIAMINGTQDPIVPYGGGTEHNLDLAVLSVEESAKAWGRIDHCDEKPERSKLPSSGKGATETKIDTFKNCQNGAAVISYSLKDRGNTWPGGLQYQVEKEVGKTSDDVNANELLWTFLSAHPLPGKSEAAK